MNKTVRGNGQYAPKANPDDPPVQRPPLGPHGLEPGPRYLGIPGRTAIVQGQVFLVAVVVVIQLWLITNALSELLSGRIGSLVWLTLASFLFFIIAMAVTIWPYHRIAEK